MGWFLHLFRHCMLSPDDQDAKKNTHEINSKNAMEPVFCEDDQTSCSTEQDECPSGKGEEIQHREARSILPTLDNIASCDEETSLFVVLTNSDSNDIGKATAREAEDKDESQVLAEVTGESVNVIPKPEGVQCYNPNSEIRPLAHQPVSLVNHCEDDAPMAPFENSSEDDDVWIPDDDNNVQTFERIAMGQTSRKNDEEQGREKETTLLESSCRDDDSTNHTDAVPRSGEGHSNVSEQEVVDAPQVASPIDNEVADEEAISDENAFVRSKDVSGKSIATKLFTGEGYENSENQSKSKSVVGDKIDIMKNEQREQTPTTPSKQQKVVLDRPDRKVIVTDDSVIVITKDKVVVTKKPTLEGELPEVVEMQRTPVKKRKSKRSSKRRSKIERGESVSLDTSLLLKPLENVNETKTPCSPTSLLYQTATTPRGA